MSGTRILTELLGEISLLLWGIHMVHSGVLRAYGSRLRHFLGVALGRRITGFLAGLGVTTLLQSSTATAFMVASFTAGGVVDLSAALAVMLGANVGTTLIVQVLSFDIAIVFPVLIFLGVALFRNANGRLRDLARVAIGLGLLLLALHLMIQTIEPVEAAPLMRDILRAIAGHPLVNVVLAAAFTWAAHSSVAAMLFIISLANAGVMDTEALLAMVVGANLGSAINPVFEGTHGDPVKLRMPVGNLLNRLAGAAVVLPILPWLSQWIQAIHISPGRVAADFHTAFNLVLAVAFIVPLGAYARLLERLLPARPKGRDEATPLYLDEAAIETPTAALSNAAREALRMADVAGRMLNRLKGLFAADDRRRIDEIRRTDDVLDRLNDHIQSYLTRISREELGDDDRQRLNEVLAFAINVEHIGDTIEKSLLELASKRRKKKLTLSREGLADIEGMLELLLDHLQLAANVFVSGEPSLARRLVREKEKFRVLESASRERHFARKRAGRAESVETTNLHIDIVRDLKQIEGFIAATVYPLLERTGQLAQSRLAATKA